MGRNVLGRNVLPFRPTQKWAEMVMGRNGIGPKRPENILYRLNMKRKSYRRGGGVYINAKRERGYSRQGMFIGGMVCTHIFFNPAACTSVCKISFITLWTLLFELIIYILCWIVLYSWQTWTCKSEIYVHDSKIHFDPIVNPLVKVK